MTLDKLLEISQREGDRKFIEAEQRRIEPYSFEEYHQSQTKIDMKVWAKYDDLWPRVNYHRIIEAYAEARGWTQEGFTGLEMPHEEEV